MGSLARTPLRLATTGGDQNGLAVEAGRSWSNRPQISVVISNYEIPAADQGPFPSPPVFNNVFAIPGIGTFTLLPHRAVTYADNDGYDLTVNHVPNGAVVSRYRVDDTHNLSLIDQSVSRGSTVRLAASLPAPSVELVVISPRRD